MNTKSKYNHVYLHFDYFRMLPDLGIIQTKYLKNDYLNIISSYLTIILK